MKKYDEMMNELEGKFNDCSEFPESLSKENIINKIKEKNIKPEEKKRFAFKMEALAAAVAVIIVAAVVMAQSGSGDIDILDSSVNATENQVEVTFNPENAVSVDEKGNELPEGVYTFKDSESAKKHVLEIFNSLEYYSYDIKYNGAVNVTAAATTVAAQAAPMADGNDTAQNIMSESAVGNSSGSYTETNQQTVGVAEGDIIKNDGRYIYVAANEYGYEPRIKIIDTETMSLVYSGKNENTKGDKIAVDEMYVNGNLLTVVYDYTKYDEKSKLVECTTYVDVYDITDRAAPTKIITKTQDGRFTSSRMIGNVLYTVSVYGVMGNSKEEAEKYALPRINGEEISGKCVFYYEEPSTRYTVVTAIDTSNKEAQSTSIAVLGSSEEVYCSESTIYCVAPFFYNGTERKTKITAFSLDGTSVTCKAKGEVTGTYNNNYSFDEYKGYLRVATTCYDYKSYKNVSSIYVLNDKLEVVGSCENIAHDEQVKSVRFMGDRGYVVTFRQTDPLFSLDLSDPENPLVKGELKLPGYSTYLHPLGENTLLGIGYGGDENNADMNKLKIALFDISDMTQPKLLDEYVIDSSSTQANYDPKALIHYAEKNIVGIPVFTFNADTSGSVKSFAIINYSENKLSQVTGFVHDSTKYGEFFRGTCTGDKLYTLDFMKVIEHSLQNGEKVRECIITDEKEEDMPSGLFATTSPYYMP